MRHHRLPLLAGAVSLGLAFAVASCNVSTSVGSYNVTYRVNLLGIATIDSVLYSPGTGKCRRRATRTRPSVKVTNPALNALGDLRRRVVPAVWGDTAGDAVWLRHRRRHRAVHGALDDGQRHRFGVTA